MDRNKRLYERQMCEALPSTLAMKVWTEVIQQDHKYPSIAEVSASFAMKRGQEERRYARLQLIQQVFA